FALGAGGNDDGVRRVEVRLLRIRDARRRIDLSWAQSRTAEVGVRTSRKMPGTVARSGVGSAAKQELVRAGVATAGLLGALGAMGLTLRHQARDATTRIESAARS